jgi:hypothetical protein
VIIRGWSLVYFETYYCAGASIAPVGGGEYVYSYDDVKAVSSVAPLCDGAARAGFDSTMPPPVAHDLEHEDLYVANPLAGPLPAPAVCHKQSHQCSNPTPTPSPSPSPSPTRTPSPTPGPTGSATPTPTPSPSPTPGGTPTPTPAPGGNCNGKGHYEVQVTIVDASYSQANGFLGAYNANVGMKARKLTE